MGFLTIIQVALTGVMLVGKLAREAEDLFSNRVEGDRKKEWVEHHLDVMADTAKDAGAPEYKTNVAVTAAKKSIDAVVSIYNLMGIFKDK